MVSDCVTKDRHFLPFKLGNKQNISGKLLLLSFMSFKISSNSDIAPNLIFLSLGWHTKGLQKTSSFVVPTINV